jgi:hypothetical protein
VTPKTERAPLAGRRGKRLAQGILTVVAAAFLVLSTWELARQVFGYDNTYPAVSAACAHALGTFEEGLDHSASQVPQLQQVPQAPLEEVERACTTPGDNEAFVAAKRLREATFSQRDDDHANLARFRRAVDMRIGR